MRLLPLQNEPKLFHDSWKRYYNLNKHSGCFSPVVWCVHGAFGWVIYHIHCMESFRNNFQAKAINSARVQVKSLKMPSQCTWCGDKLRDFISGMCAWMTTMISTNAPLPLHPNGSIANKWHRINSKPMIALAVCEWCFRIWKLSKWNIARDEWAN